MPLAEFVEKFALLFSPIDADDDLEGWILQLQERATAISRSRAARSSLEALLETMIDMGLVVLRRHLRRFQG